MAVAKKKRVSKVKSSNNGHAPKEYELTALDKKIIEQVKSMEKGSAKRKSVGDAVPYEDKTRDPYRHVVRTALIRLVREGYLKMEGVKAGCYYVVK